MSDQVPKTASRCSKGVIAPNATPSGCSATTPSADVRLEGVATATPPVREVGQVESQKHAKSDNVTLEEVKKAYLELASQKRPTSVTQLRKVIGHGSFSTIGKYRDEIEKHYAAQFQDAANTSDNPEIRQLTRELTATLSEIVVRFTIKSKDDVIASLKDQIVGLNAKMQEAETNHAHQFECLLGTNNDLKSSLNRAHEEGNQLRADKDDLIKGKASLTRRLEKYKEIKKLLDELKLTPEEAIEQLKKQKASKRQGSKSTKNST